MLSFYFFIFYILKILYIYSWETQRGAETQAEGEAGPCREPDVGLDPRTPGSCPEQKANSQPLSHPGALLCAILTILFTQKVFTNANVTRPIPRISIILSLLNSCFLTYCVLQRSLTASSSLGNRFFYISIIAYGGSLKFCFDLVLFCLLTQWASGLSFP